MGYGVFAISKIKIRTIIAEYLGDIMTTEEVEIADKNNKLNEHGKNSRMLLLKTSKKSTSLEVVPYFHSNIARFLNGKDQTNKENIEVFRVAVNGMVTIIMQAKTNIKKGEELIWDYGDKYPKDYKKA